MFLSVSFHVVLDSLLTGMKMKVILSDYISPTDAITLQEHIRKQPYASDVKYISKEEAMKFFDRTGDSFKDAMDGVNPLPAVIQVQLKSEYVSPENVETIGKKLLERNHVVEIYYPIKQIAAIMDNLEKIQWITLGLGIALTLVALLLIINTIRLAIYSKRLLIRSMQLIGATKGFIRRPFLRLGTIQGLLAGLIASSMILGICMYSTLSGFFNLSLILESWQFQSLLGGLVVFGLLLGYFSSRIAVNRFLDRNPDALYS
jgi:cell division transport system permease protein